MSEQINPGQVEENRAPSSGLLLSVEPLQESGRLSATPADNVDTDTDMTDTSDAATDADGTDEADASDTDATDGGGGDSDGTDTPGGDSDGTDVSIDSDRSDS